ncbi:MAG: short chain dehydrogenase family protein [Burkholderiaceae bacterium]|nr:short chain dehydrogenase family protein [Burkholderiaceae bacterium]
MTNVNTAHSWALVTGASSGLGVDFAHELAAKGYSLVLTARRKDRLQALAAEIEAHHAVQTKVIALDLAEPGAAAELKRQLHGEAITIDVLINNAGFGIFGELIEQPPARVQAMLQLNIAALTELTQLYATEMVQRQRGQILLVASVVAYQASPNYAAYAASKAYVLSFGEALHEELRPHGVTVTVLSPGATATEFFDVSGQQSTPMKRAFMMPSRPVVQIGLAAMRRGRASVVPGWKNALMTWSTRLLPRIVQRKMAHWVLRKE